MTKIWPSISAALANAARTAVAPQTFDPTALLLSRFAYGPTPSERAWVAARGPQAWYDAQVATARANPGYSAHPEVAALGPLLTMSPYDVRDYLTAHGNPYAWTAMDQLSFVTMGLAAWSPAQLYEVLVDVFANHLNVPNHFGDVWNTRGSYDRDVIRAHAMGSFTNMLLASARHPAMLIYLSLSLSNKGDVNENYGRELLELHTVGRHYSEADVVACARLMTGRTVDDYQHFLFDGYIHPTGAVQVLDFTHPNTSEEGGLSAGDALLRYLAAHSYTAQNLARKMCVRFVSDTPSQTLVDAVAAAYTASKTQILPMVETILRSDEFWASRGAKIRRPAENVVASVRAVNPPIDDLYKATQYLTWVTQQMGNLPLNWQAPNGYPDVAEAWISSGSLLAQWNVHLGVSGGWLPGLKAPMGLYGSTVPATSGAAVDAMCQALTGQVFSTTHRTVLQTFLNEPASTPMANSSLRWLAAPLAACILDGPHHALR